MFRLVKGLGCIGILMLSFSLAGCDSPEEKALDYLTQGQSYYTAGEFDKADIEARNALKLNPQLASAHYLRAQIFEKRLAWGQMFGELQTVVQIEPTHLDANLQLAKFHAIGNRTEEAQSAVDKARQAAPDDFRVKRAQAMVDMRLGKSDSAITQLQDALEQQPDDLESLMLLGSALISRKEFFAADDTLQQAQRHHPDSSDVRLLEFRLYAAQNKVEEARGVLDQLIAKNPAELGFRKTLALYLTHSDRADEAEQVLRTAVDDLPGNVDAKLALAGFLGSRNVEAAIEFLKGSAADEAGTSGKLHMALADVYTRAGDLESAAGVYREISTSTDTDGALFAKNRLAQIAMKQNHPDEAKAIITEILDADPANIAALVSRAAIFLQDRQTDAAIADLREALRQNPALDQAHFLMGEAQLQNSAIELAEDSFAEAIKLNPRNEAAALSYAQLQLRKGNHDRARKVLQPLTQGQNPSSRASVLLVQVNFAARDWDRALGAADEAARISDRPAIKAFTQALVLQEEGKHAEAVGTFKTLLANDSKMTGALAGAVKSLNVLGQAAEAEKLIKSYMAANPENRDALQLLVSQYVNNKQLDKARSLLQQQVKEEPNWLGGYRGLIALAVTDGNNQLARQLSEQALAANPGAVEFELRIANLLELQGDKQGAEGRYRVLLEKVPALDVAANNLAVLVAGDGKDQARLAEARQISARFENSEQPWFADTLGWILFQQGDYIKASELLQRATKHAPEEAQFRYHLGAALSALNNHEGARMQLEKAVSIAESKGTFDGYQDAVALLARLSQEK